jgi:hypothetical protein
MAVQDNNIPEPAEVFRLTGRQKAIAEKLHNLIGPALRAMYVDACRLVETKTKLQSEALLVGHLVREIESAIRSVLSPITAAKTSEESRRVEFRQQRIKEVLDEISFPEDHHAAKKLLASIENPNSHKENIRAIISMLGLKEDDDVCRFWLEIPEALARKAHRKGLAKSGRIDEDFRNKFWNNFEHILLGVLTQMEKIYLKLLEKVDEIKDTPSKDGAAFLTQSLPSNFIIQRRFFDGNTRQEWVALLKGSAVFRQPPDVEVLDDAEHIGPLHWPVMDYLKLMAAIKDEKIENDITEIVLSIPSTSNVRVNSGIIDIAEALPIEKSKSLKGRIINAGVALGGSIFMRDFSSLLRYWVSSGAGKEALELAAWLFDVEKDDGAEDLYRGRYKTKFRDYDYKEAINGSLPALMKEDRFATLKLFCELLNKGFDIQYEQRSNDDYSVMIRPDIGEHESYHSELNTLISAVRDCGAKIVEENPIQYAEVSKVLKSYKWGVFGRLDIYLLSCAPQADEQKLREFLLNRKNFDSHKFYYEYRSVAKEGFKHLAKADQEKIISWLDELDVEDVRQWYRKNKGMEATQNDIERLQAERFRHNVYGWEAALPENLQNKYHDIVQRHGEETPINKVSSVWRGPESPIDASEMGKWGMETLIEYLKTWKAEDGIFKPTADGLGQAIMLVISADVTKFSQKADQFKNLRSTYIHSFLRAIGDGLQKEKEIDWQKVLELCLFAVQQEDSAQESDTSDSWLWVRTKACDLLKAGFNSNTKCPLPASCREVSWQIITRLLTDSDPTPNEEEKATKRDQDDYHGVAINSVRSQALESAILYSLWLRRQDSTINFEKASEVAAALDWHIDRTKEQSKAVRSVYGCYFPWINLLDSGWATRNVSNIFSSPLASDPAWKTYITYTKFYKDCYEPLRSFYEAAALELAGVEVDLEKPYFKGLCTHIVFIYLNGTEGARDLLSKLIESAPDSLRGYIMRFMGMVLTDNNDLPSDEVNLIAAYACARLPNASQHELESFGYWFPNTHLKPSWMLTTLTDILRRAAKIDGHEDIIEYLVTQAQDHLVSVLECLEKILFHTGIEYWTIEYKRAEVRAILSTALSSDNDDASVKATEMINQLVAKGLISFEELLRPQQQAA